MSVHSNLSSEKSGVLQTTHHWRNASQQGEQKGSRRDGFIQIGGLQGIVLGIVVCKPVANDTQRLPIVQLRQIAFFFKAVKLVDHGAVLEGLLQVF